jgi:hypothetical protein
LQHVLMKVRLKPGTFQKFMKYVEEFAERRDECAASLKGEGADIESFFIVGEDVFVYKRVKDLAAARKHQKASDKPIYGVVEKMRAECIESLEDYFSVLAFEVKRFKARG